MSNKQPQLPEHAKLRAALEFAGVHLIAASGEIKHLFGNMGEHVDPVIRHSVIPEILRHINELTAAVEHYEFATREATSPLVPEYDREASIARGRQ